MFQKSEKQKICDWVVDVMQHNVQILNELSGKKTQKDIEIIENDGEKEIALKDVHKLLDDRFEKHRLLGQ